MNTVKCCDLGVSNDIFGTPEIILPMPSERYFKVYCEEHVHKMDHGVLVLRIC